MRKWILVFCLMFFLTGTASAKEATGVQVEVLSKSVLSWDGKPLPDYTRGKPEVTILRIKIPPGTTLPLHKHPVINAGVLISGELTVVTDEKKVLHLKAGQSLVEVVNTWHYGKNEGTVPAEIIVFYAGTTDTPITVNKDAESH